MHERMLLHPSVRGLGPQAGNAACCTFFPCVHQNGFRFPSGRTCMDVARAWTSPTVSIHQAVLLHFPRTARPSWSLNKCSTGVATTQGWAWPMSVPPTHGSCTLNGIPLQAGTCRAGLQPVGLVPRPAAPRAQRICRVRALATAGRSVLVPAAGSWQAFERTHVPGVLPVPVPVDQSEWPVRHFPTCSQAVSPCGLVMLSPLLMPAVTQGRGPAAACAHRVG